MHIYIYMSFGPKGTMMFLLCPCSCILPMCIINIVFDVLLFEVVPYPIAIL